MSSKCRKCSALQALCRTLEQIRRRRVSHLLGPTQCPSAEYGARTSTHRLPLRTLLGYRRPRTRRAPVYWLVVAASRHHGRALRLITRLLWSLKASRVPICPLIDLTAMFLFAFAHVCASFPPISTAIGHSILCKKETARQEKCRRVYSVPLLTW